MEREREIERERAHPGQLAAVMNIRGCGVNLMTCETNSPAETSDSAC